MSIDGRVVTNLFNLITMLNRKPEWCNSVTIFAQEKLSSTPKQRYKIGKTLAFLDSVWN